jgi:zinc protease
MLSSLDGIAERWAAVPAPDLPADPTWDPARAGVYFVDVPGSAQSVLRIGYLAMPETHPDYWPAEVMNFRLGGGGFASELTLTLREGLGYTYGIGSGFSGGQRAGPFSISSGVRSNVTAESLEVIRQLVEGHGAGFDDEDLEITRGFLLRNNAMAYETLGAKLGLLSSMSAFGFPADFALQRAAEVEEMTVGRIRGLADQYLDPAGLVWLVVGDAVSQMGRLEALGLGPPVLIAR